MSNHTGEILTTGKDYYAQYREIHASNPNIAHKVRIASEEYLAYIGERYLDPAAALDDYIDFPNEFERFVRKETYLGYTFKKSSGNWKALGAKDPNELGYFDLDTRPFESDKASLSTDIFSADCETEDVTLVLNVYDDFPVVGRWKEKLSIDVDRIELDSRIISVLASANIKDTNLNKGWGLRCQPQRKLLTRTPIRLTFESLSFRHDYGRKNVRNGGRKLLGYFDELDSGRIQSR